MPAALLLFLSPFLIADTATEILNLFTAAAEALTNDDSAQFLDGFDRNMPGYAALRTNVEGLLAAYDVGSAIEEVTNEGDDRKRTVELDWFLTTTQKGALNGTPATRRQIVKCSLERRGKRWKITALEPADFFRP